MKFRVHGGTAFAYMLTGLGEQDAIFDIGDSVRPVRASWSREEDAVAVCQLAKEFNIPHWRAPDYLG